MPSVFAINLFNHVIYPILHDYVDGWTIYTLLCTFKSINDFYEYNSHLLHIYLNKYTYRIPKIIKTKFPKCTIYIKLPTFDVYQDMPVYTYLPSYVDRAFVDNTRRYELNRVSSMPPIMSNDLPPIFDKHDMIYTRYYDVIGYEHEFNYIGRVIQHASLIKASEHILPYIDKPNGISKDKLHIEFMFPMPQIELMKYTGCRAITYLHPITDVSAFKNSKVVKIFTFTKSIENLHTLSNVHHLSLRSCRIDPDIGLSGLHNVRILNISYTNVRTLDGLINIEELDISNCKHLTDISALKICSKLNKLIHIDTKIDLLDLHPNCLEIIDYK